MPIRLRRSHVRSELLIPDGSVMTSVNHDLRVQSRLLSDPDFWVIVMTLIVMAQRTGPVE